MVFPLDFDWGVWIPLYEATCLHLVVIWEKNTKTMSKLASLEVDSKGGREATQVDGTYLLKTMLKKIFHLLNSCSRDLHHGEYPKRSLNIQITDAPSLPPSQSSYF